jgi:hypothetical protein
MMEPAVMGEQFQEDRHSREDELSIDSHETGKQRRSPADSRSRSLDDDSEKQTVCYSYFILSIFHIAVVI